MVHCKGLGFNPTKGSGGGGKLLSEPIILAITDGESHLFILSHLILRISSEIIIIIIL